MGKLGILIIQLIFSGLNIVGGLFILNLSWEIFKVFPENQTISQGLAILSALGLSMIFYGFSSGNLYYNDYRSEENTNNILEKLNRIENKIDLLIPCSSLTLPINSKDEVEQMSWFVTRKAGIFFVGLIFFILGGFSLTLGNYLFSSALLSIALILDIAVVQ